MVFLDVALVALVVGKLVGGRFSALADTPIAGTKLVFAAIVLQMIAFPWNFLPWTTPSDLARALWLASFALLVLMLVQNRALRGAMISAPRSARFSTSISTSMAKETSQIPRARSEGVVHGRKFHGKAIICSPIAAKTSHVATILISPSAAKRPPSSLPMTNPTRATSRKTMRPTPCRVPHRQLRATAPGVPDGRATRRR